MRILFADLAKARRDLIDSHELDDGTFLTRLWYQHLFWICSFVKTATGIYAKRLVRTGIELYCKAADRNPGRPLVRRQPLPALPGTSSAGVRASSGENPRTQRAAAGPRRAQIRPPPTRRNSPQPALRGYRPHPPRPLTRGLFPHYQVFAGLRAAAYSSPVSNHSSDFPNSRLILSKISAPISTSPRSMVDR
jgi:hypothetical protein